VPSAFEVLAMGAAREPMSAARVPFRDLGAGDRLEEIAAARG
jgi:hypothetical protein